MLWDLVVTIDNQVRLKHASTVMHVETRRALGLPQEPVDMATELAGYLNAMSEQILQRPPRFAHPILAVSVNPYARRF